MIVFNTDKRAALSSNLSIVRYDHADQFGGPAPTSGQPLYPGTPLWTGIKFELPLGPSEAPYKYLLRTSGNINIAHKCIPLSGLPDYGLMAMARIALVKATSFEAMAEEGSCPDESSIIKLAGTNIPNFDAHYAALNLSARKEILGGFYRVELWVGAGGEGVANADNLACLKFYNAPNVHQFNVEVEKLG